MSALLEVFLAVLPVFLIIGAGMLADRFHYLPAQTSAILSAFVLRIGLPLMLVAIMSGADPQALSRSGFWYALLIAQGIIYLIGYGADILFARRGQGPAAITALSASCCNAAFLGLPIILNLFPGHPEALIAAGIATITPSVSMLSGQAHLELLRQKGLGASGSLPRILLRAVLGNPLLLGLGLGILLCLTGIGLWAPLERACGLIGATCAPCALLALGLDIRERLRVALRGQNHVLLHQSFVILTKLILHPLLAWALLAAFGIEGVWLAVGVIMAGTASGVAVYMMGEYYRTIPEESALSVVLTNGLALFTMSAFAYVFKVLGLF